MGTRFSITHSVQKQERLSVDGDFHCLLISPHAHATLRSIFAVVSPLFFLSSSSAKNSTSASHHGDEPFNSLPADGPHPRPPGAGRLVSLNHDDDITKDRKTRKKGKWQTASKRRRYFAPPPAAADAAAPQRQLI